MPIAEGCQARSDGLNFGQYLISKYILKFLLQCASRAVDF